jgi:predicted lipid-binding transport protein (Tim44 family)
MQTILGDDKEEKVRKSELKSILNAGVYGFVLGGLIGGVLAGYGGFLVGLFCGAFLMSLFSVLGIKATRREHDRRTQAEGGNGIKPAPPSLPRRRGGRAG